MKRALTCLLVMPAGSAIAGAWTCGNPDVEVGCSETRCEAQSHGFTPMNVSFNVAGELDVCMYSGCWIGRGDPVDANGFLVITARDLVWSTDPEPGEMRQDLAIVLDRRDNVAVLKAGSYTQPLLCRVTPGATGQAASRPPGFTASARRHA